MEDVCLTCGDKGFEEALIFCDTCEKYAAHRYCLDSKTVNFTDYIVWFCDEDCEPSNSVSNSMEIDQTAKLGRIRKKNGKKKNPRLNEENKKKTRGTHEILSRLEDHRHEHLAPVEHREVCSDSVDKTKKESERKKCLNSETSNKRSGSVRNEASFLPGNNPSAVPELDIFASKQSKSNSGGRCEESESLEKRTPLGAINDLSNIRQLSCVSKELAARSFCKEAESNRTKTSQRGYIRAQPIMDPIWWGSLCLGQESFGSIDGLVAHLSNLACARVAEAAGSLSRRLSPELFPRLDIWPKSFLRKGGANDESIGLYFFPSSQSDEKIFDSLVEEMMNKDLAMRTVLDDAELLLFTSYALPMPSWRFQEKFYLWGVFKGKQAPPHQ